MQISYLPSGSWLAHTPETGGIILWADTPAATARMGTPCHLTSPPLTWGSCDEDEYSTVTNWITVTELAPTDNPDIPVPEELAALNLHAAYCNGKLWLKISPETITQQGEDHPNSPADATATGDKNTLNQNHRPLTPTLQIIPITQRDTILRPNGTWRTDIPFEIIGTYAYHVGENPFANFSETQYNITLFAAYADGMLAFTAAASKHQNENGNITYSRAPLASSFGHEMWNKGYALETHIADPPWGNQRQETPVTPPTDNLPAGTNGILTATEDKNTHRTATAPSAVTTPLEIAPKLINPTDLLSLATDTTFENLEASYNGISIPDTFGCTTRQLAEAMLTPSFGWAYDPLRYATDPQAFNNRWYTDSPWYYTGKNAPYLGGKTLQNGATYGAYPAPYALLFAEGADTYNLTAPCGCRPWKRTAYTHITTPQHNLFIALYGADDGNGTLMTASWYGTYNYTENNGTHPGGEEETTPPSTTHRPTGGGGSEEDPDNPDPTDPDTPNNHLILLELSDEMELAGELEDTEYTILTTKDITLPVTAPAMGEIHWKNTFTAPGQYATVESGFGTITATGKQPAETTARLLFHGTNNIDTSKKEEKIPITWHITATATIPAGALLARIPKNTAPAPADGTITVKQTDTYTYHLALNHTAIAAKIARKLTGIIGSAAKKYTIENTTATALTPSATITLTAEGNLKKTTILIHNT